MKQYSTISLILIIVGILSLCILIASSFLYSSIEQVSLLIGFGLITSITLIISHRVYKLDRHKFLWNPLFLIALYIFVADGIPALLISFSTNFIYMFEIGQQVFISLSSFVSATVLVMGSLLSFWLVYEIIEKNNINTYNIITKHSAVQERPGKLYLITLIVLYIVVLISRYDFFFVKEIYLADLSGARQEVSYLYGMMVPFDIAGCFLMAAMAYYSNYKKRMWSIILFIIGFIDVTYAIAITHKERLLAMFASILFCEVFFNKRPSLRRQLYWLVVAFFIMAIIGPLCQNLRYTYSKVGVEKNPLALTQLIKDQQAEISIRDQAEYLLRRSAELDVVARAIETFPSNVSYQYGKTYLQGIFSSIPFSEPDYPVTYPEVWRYLIRGLPIGALLHIGSKVPWIAEGYANFGFLGAFGSAMMWSFLLTLLWRYFRHSISYAKGLLFFFLYYNIAFLGTHNGFLIILKHLLTWSPILGIVLFLLWPKSKKQDFAIRV